MSDNELPAEAGEILSRLKKKYRTEFDDLRLSGCELKILQVSDIEPLLEGKDPFADVSTFPFWVRLWEAALVLADLMSRQNQLSLGRVLELGAGLGAPGLAAAAAGGDVTLSDYEEHIIDFQKVSAAANDLENVKFKLIDWNKPPKMEPFDTIIGAEILFREDFFQPLLGIFRKFLSPGGTVYLAHDSERRSLKPFLDLAAEHFKIAAMSSKVTSEDKDVTIVLTRLRHKDAG